MKGLAAGSSPLWSQPVVSCHAAAVSLPCGAPLTPQPRSRRKVSWQPLLRDATQLLPQLAPVCHHQQHPRVVCPAASAPQPSFLLPSLRAGQVKAPELLPAAGPHRPTSPSTGTHLTTNGLASPPAPQLVLWPPGPDLEAQSESQPHLATTTHFASHGIQGPGNQSTSSFSGAANRYDSRPLSDQRDGGDRMRSSHAPSTSWQHTSNAGPSPAMATPGPSTAGAPMGPQLSHAVGSSRLRDFLPMLPQGAVGAAQGGRRVWQAAAAGPQQEAPHDTTASLLAQGKLPGKKGWPRRQQSARPQAAKQRQPQPSMQQQPPQPAMQQHQPQLSMQQHQSQPPRQQQQLRPPRQQQQSQPPRQQQQPQLSRRQQQSQPAATSQQQPYSLDGEELAHALAAADAAMAATPAATLAGPSPRPPRQPAAPASTAATASRRQTQMTVAPSNSHDGSSQPWAGPLWDDRQVTHAIGQSSDWRSVADLLLQPDMRPLNHIHVTAAWRRLERLSSAGQGGGLSVHGGTGSKAPPYTTHLPVDGVECLGTENSRDWRLGHGEEYTALLVRLDDLTLSTAHAMGPREASTILWVAARIKYVPKQQTTVSLLQAVLKQPARHSDLDLSQSIWALGKLLQRSGTGTAHAPGSAAAMQPHMVYDVLPEPLPAISQQKGQAAPARRASADPAATQQDLRQQSSFMPKDDTHQVSDGLHENGMPNSDERRQMMHTFAPSQASAAFGNKRLASTDGQGLTGSTLMDLLHQLVCVVIDRMPSMTDRCMVISLHGVSMLHGLVAVKDTPARMLQLAEARSHALRARDLATVLSSLVQLGCRPQEAWLKASMVQVARVLADFRCEEVSLLMYACSMLQFRPAPMLLLDLCRHTSRRLSTASVHHLSLLLWSLSKLQWRPPSDWLDALMAEMVERHTELQPQELTLTLYGLAVLRYVPEPPVLKVLMDRVERMMTPKLLPMQLATICWALPNLAPDVGRGVRKGIMLIGCKKRRQLTSEGFAKLLWCVARISVVPPYKAWVRTMFNEFLRRRASLGPQALPLAMWALAKMGYHNSQFLFEPRHMYLVWQVARPLLPVMQLQGLTSLLHASAWVNFAPRNDILQECADAVSLHGASMSSSTLQSVSAVLWGMRMRRAQLNMRSFKLCLDRDGVRAQGKRPVIRRKMPQTKIVRLVGGDGRPWQREWRPVGWVYKTQVRAVSISLKKPKRIQSMGQD